MQKNQKRKREESIPRGEPQREKIHKPIVVEPSSLEVVPRASFLDGTISDIKGIEPSIVMHQIHLEEGAKPSCEPSV